MPRWRTRPASDRRSAGARRCRSSRPAPARSPPGTAEAGSRPMPARCFQCRTWQSGPLNARVYWRRLQKEPPERVPDAEEDQNHRGHRHGNQADHRAEAGSVAVHRCESYVSRARAPTAAVKGVAAPALRVLSDLAALYAVNPERTPFNAAVRAPGRHRTHAPATPGLRGPGPSAYSSGEQVAARSHAGPAGVIWICPAEPDKNR